MTPKPRSETPNQEPERCDDWIEIGTVCRLEAGHAGMHEDETIRWEWK